MKKLVAITLFILIGATSMFASTSKYRLNDESVDVLINQAIEISIDQLTNDVSNRLANLPMSDLQFNAEKKTVVAFLLNWFFGYLGIHRLYLGTSTGTFIGYILTCGGLGIVQFVDWIVLLIALIEDSDISKYVDNPKFFMWLD